MVRGAHTVVGSFEKIVEKLRMMLGAANCRVEWDGVNLIRFEQQEDYYTLPKSGVIHLSKRIGFTRIEWSVSVKESMRLVFIVLAVLFCWTVIFPIRVNHMLNHFPREFMENLMTAL
ncbi:MAG: hypothetical protein E3J72_09480 [Planctomycetota bacterium]|nr:MAG: hypothetical protein E3J72_09480 [Planctomycetota bacterium]